MPHNLNVQKKPKFSLLALLAFIFIAFLFTNAGNVNAAECTTGTPDAIAACQALEAKKTTELGTIERDADKAFAGCVSGAVANGCGFLEKYINPLINFLAGIVGLAVTGMIIFGGIQFSSAGGDPNKVAAAKGKITNALVALLAFLFLYAGLQWVVPGGVF